MSKGALNNPLNTIILDSFYEENLKTWDEASKDLDELADLLYFGTTPGRQRFKEQLINAAKSTAGIKIEKNNWLRIVTYKYSLSPLSEAGSLINSGRFNIGKNIEKNAQTVWGAIYIAEDHETAYREKFQVKIEDETPGLKPEELSLVKENNISSVNIKFNLQNIFDLTEQSNLSHIANVLSKIKIPDGAQELNKKINRKRKLAKIPAIKMIKSSKALFESIFESNWNLLPTIYEIPSNSQITAEIIKLAGFEGIIYQSTKSNGKCIAIFRDNLLEGSYVELSGEFPKEVTEYQIKGAKKILA